MPDNPILEIYDTVPDASRWSSTLDVISRSIGALGGGVYVRRVDEQPYDFAAVSSVYRPEFIKQYIERRYGVYEAAQWNYLNSCQPLELVLDDQAGVSREILDARPDYIYNRKEIGIGRRVAVRLNAIPAWYDAMIFAFGAEQTEVPEASLAALRPLLPHLAKAVEVGRAFAMLRQRYQAALAVLDRVGVGLGIALPSGELLVHNSEASRIFDSSDGLDLGRDRRLRCRMHAQKVRIEAAIREVSRTLHGDANCREMLEIVDRTSGRDPFLVEVAPLSDSGGEIERGLAGALVTIIDPDNVPTLNVRRFATLNGLTPAEIEVCQLLVLGSSSFEIAERRGTSLETVKSQIRSIMFKSGCHGRGEIIRSVLRTVPPIY